MDSLRDVRVLVTGASGFIGSHLTRRLIDEGAEVHALTSAVSSVFPLRLVDVRDRIVLHAGNLTDRSAMDGIVLQARAEVVFHLGAYTHVRKSWERVDECVQTNVQGTVNLLQALAGTGYRRFVNVGTSEIYGGIDVPFREAAKAEPISPYAVSKFAAERFCRMFHRGYGWPIVMLRPFNAYGPGQSPDRIVAELIVRALRGEDIDMTEGRQTREFNYVADLVDGLVRAAVTPGVEGELFNVGCGEEVAIRDLAVRLLDLMGNPVKPRFGVLPDRLAEIWHMYSDSTKARERLGWQPTRSLDEGLRTTIEWYRAELETGSSPFDLSP